MSLVCNVSVFESLREHYPDWPSLQAYLESEEGGFLKITDSSEKECIIRYDKHHSLMDLPHVRWFRSVVWNKEHHFPVSVAPPKATSSSFPFPYKNYPLSEIQTKCEEKELSVEEYKDGFMIQVYRIKGDPTIYIASRSKRDASGTFYSSKSFRTLFLEAYGSEPVLEEPDEAFSTFLSYVVQHSEHRIVTPHTTPRAILVQKGIVSSTGSVVLYDGFSPLSLPLAQSSSDSSKTVSEWIQECCQTMPWSFRGIVIKDKSGERWRFCSEKYRAIQMLRGNEPHIYERYARIFTQNLNGTYLEYYPEDIIPFSLCGVFMNDIVQHLYRMYHAVFIRKSSTFTQLHAIYRPHLYAIHGIYLTTLRPLTKWITTQEIRVYLVGHHPSRIAHLIRHHQDEYHSRITQTV